MNKLEAIEILRIWDKKGKYVFTKHDLQKLFFQDSPASLTASLNRLVKDKLLIRACSGVYVNPNAISFDGYTLEHIAIALRKGEYNYLSLESALSEYGIISQILMDRITVMTTGRKGTYKTVFGVIEYTHTKRPASDILKGISKIEKRPLRIASKKIAWRDLKRVGRNTAMVNLEELNDPDE